MRDELSAVSTADNFHPLKTTVTLRVAGEILNTKRSKMYDLLGAGLLKAVKDGPRVMVLIDSIKAYQASLPVASFAPPSKLSSAANSAKLPRRRRRKSKAVPE
jgi:hypothetical protein